MAKNKSKKKNKPEVVATPSKKERKALAARAAHLAAELAERDGASVPVLYNLGNAAFRAGKPGEAILAYERALRPRPRGRAAAGGRVGPR